jgi:ComF family protein
VRVTTLHAAVCRLKPLWTIPTSIFSFVFPPCCLSCRSLLPDCHILLCDECASELRRVRAGEPVYRKTLEGLVRDGLIEGLVAPYYFEKEGPLQQMVHQLKYSGMIAAGTFLGEAIANALAEAVPDPSSAVIIPVPLHRVKLRERGYNQAEIIARGIARHTGGKVDGATLRRIIHTSSQTTLDSKERAKNVAGAFAVRTRKEGSLKGDTVLLVDDVITTGATIRSCALALQTSGVRSIVACAAALAL